MTPDTVIDAAVVEESPESGALARPQRPRPPNAGKGRVKGTPNKLTSDVREMVLKALKQEGGVSYLRQQAQTNPVAFMALVAKCLPTRVQGDGESPVTIIVRRPWE